MWKKLHKLWCQQTFQKRTFLDVKRTNFIESHTRQITKDSVIVSCQ